MEAEAALVWSDGAVEFHTVSAVHLNLALVIDPRHAEQDGSFRFHDPFQNRVVFILGIRSQNRFDRAEHFLNGLDEFFSWLCLALTKSSTRWEYVCAIFSVVVFGLTLYAQFFARAFRLSFREADWQSFFPWRPSGVSKKIENMFICCDL